MSPRPGVGAGAENGTNAIDTVATMRSTALLSALTLATLTVAACGTDGGDDPAPTTLAPETESEAATADESPTEAETENGGEAENGTETENGADAMDEVDGADADDNGTSDEVQRYPDVIDATAERVGDTWTVSATLSSPYDTPERYADAWRVVGPDGTVYGERVLAHDHAVEQPFTRSQSGIEIPDGVTEVVIEGRDLEYGYGGSTFTLSLPAEE